jgi:hypothetical protein
LGLEDGATAMFDFVCPVGQPTEEGTHVLADLGLGAEAGVSGHFGADSTPDVLIGVEIRAVGRQADQAEPQVWVVK